MKKHLFFVCIFLLLAMPAMAAESETANLTAQNTFTSSISPRYGFLNISISGTWAGTVTLQRSFDSGSNWLDVDTWTSNIQTSLFDYTETVLYRLGIKTGEYTSGTAIVGLYQ